MGLELSSEHFASVAQLDRALASGARGCGFDPRRTQLITVAARPSSKIQARMHVKKRAFIALETESQPNSGIR